MKAAILHSPDHNDEQDLTSYARSLAEILLMANDLLDGDLRATIEATPSTDDPNVLARLLLPHSIRATLANSADPYDTSLARASMIFTQLAVRDDVRSRAKGAWTDISKRFRAQTGLSLQDYFAIGWMLMQWFAGGVRDPQKNINQRKLIPATFFSETSTTLSL